MRQGYRFRMHLLRIPVPFVLPGPRRTRRWQRSAESATPTSWWSSGRSLGSAWSVSSMWSFASVLSVGSAGSILSIGSAGSILSIGSAGSILSVGSFGSIASVGSSGSLSTVGASGARGSDSDNEEGEAAKRPRPSPIETGATLLGAAALLTSMRDAL
jgi:hypothetical protein